LIVLRCVYALVAGVALRVDAQSHAETGTGSSSPIPLETFEEPRIKSRSPGYYPLDEIRTLGEGWVNLSLMVDSKGKPYEIAVTDSTGNRDFERAAVAAVSQWTYQPGSVNGQPIDSATQLTESVQAAFSDCRQRWVHRPGETTVQKALRKFRI
jgi:TonB family protein